MATSRHAATTRPATTRRRLLLAVLCAAPFVLVLDTTVVTVALPSIGRELGFSTATLHWVLASYALVFGGLLLLGGRLGDLFGHRRLFLAGARLFAAASAVGGLAVAPWMLLAARVLQGVGAAALMPAALALVTATFPDGPERDRALGIYSGVAASVPPPAWSLAGPHPAPRLAVGAVRRRADRAPHLPRAGIGGHRPRPPGHAAAARSAGRRHRHGCAGRAAVRPHRSQGRRVDRTDDPRALDRRPDPAWGVRGRGAPRAAPLVPLATFRIRPVTVANAVLLLESATTAYAFVLTLYFQQVLGLSPLATGLCFLPLAVAAAIAAPVAGRVDRHSRRPTGDPTPGPDRPGGRAPVDGDRPGRPASPA